jgi:Spy/CpxP family protein refolding chaperone
MTVFTLFVSLYTGGVIAQDHAQSPRADARGGHAPPPQAYEDCRGKKSGDTVQHITPDGVVAATCIDSPHGLVARPTQGRGPGQDQGIKQGSPEERGSGNQPPRSQAPQEGGRKYSLEQAISDQAQLNTIAFDGLAFLTGDFGYDTFLPPGKVADYFGFQYMRDIDAREGGHNTSFLTKIAHNMLTILNDSQKADLLALAQEQEGDIKRFAQMRLPLIKAFRLNLEDKLPAGSAGLDKQAVMTYSADLYALDGKLSYDRAKVMASVLRSLTPAQKAALAQLKFGDSATWPNVAEPLDRRGMSHEVSVAVMTYASEMFSWHAGSIEADTYFCPERHGMYFGGFGMKTAPAMGKRDYSISTTLTGNSGEAFLATLNDSQRRQIIVLTDLQRQDLNEIVRVRRAISTELRRFLKGETADQAKVLALSTRYGELDGNLSYFYATTFAKVGQTLTPRQKQTLLAMRTADPTEPKGPFLYSSPISTPRIDDTDQFFGIRR